VRAALLTVFATLLTGPATAPQATTLRVLFIGNSLTAANNLPQMVSDIAEAAGTPRILTGAVTAANVSLEDHWQSGEARAAIARGGWNVVVLQQGPSSLPESQVLLRGSARRFGLEIRKSGAKPALYMVWPSKARFRDFDGVSTSYTRAAADVEGMLLPAGDAWRAAWQRDADLPLYGGDQFHPSRLGTYLAALVIYETLTGRTTVGLPAGVKGKEFTPACVRLLQEAAHEAVTRAGARRE
jgi:hypothetical protein